MPTPPLSPTPRRWRSSPDNPHPDFAALLSTFEPGSTAPPTAPAPATEADSRSSAPSWATPKSRHTAASSSHRDEDDEDAVEYMTATESEHKARSTASTSVSRARTPEIRTTSPSPQRPVPSARSDMSLSPLMPPSRSQLFGDDASATGARADVTRDPYQTRPGLPDRTESSYSSSSHTPTHPNPPQITGQSTRSTRSTNTIDAAYDGVLSTLDALANPSFLTHTRGASDPGPASSLSTTSPAHSPAISTYTPTPLRQPLVGLSNRLPDAKALFATDAGTQPSRLSTVSERSERSSRSAASGSAASPTNIPGAWRESRTDHSAASVASRYPLPPSPVKPGARSPVGSIGAASGAAATGAGATGTPQATPKKTSDLIKMFESRATPGSEPVLAQPVFTPTTPSRTMAKAASGTGTPLKSEPLFSPPTYTVGAATTSSTAPAVPPTYSRGGFSPAPYAPPSPPPKSPSPLSQVRTMIASWRTRAGSPSLRAASPGTGASAAGKDGPRLFGRGGDKGWNVSIRRRRRNERELAERGDEAEHAAGDGAERQPEQEREREEAYVPEYGYGEEQGREEQEEKKVPSRASSYRSERKATSEPKQFTGEPIRTGALYYLNVHDEDLRPNFEWVQADGRLYNEGLELSWVSARGRATVTLDLEFCDEVASTYSPNNPMAGEDIGAAAARRQGELADSLYPFKLVYDDGVERLACDSARDRVRWVNGIWTVLEHTRAPAMPRTASLRANRSISEHGSDAGGSASTHFTPGADRADHALPHPSPLGSSHSHPLYTTDDAVVETSGGGHAPLVQRGSRRLAVGGLERNRSLRRVASEADLRESAVDPPPLPEKDEGRGIQDIPLTAENAQRPLSRDFQFAFGTRPPTLADESERGFFSPPSGSEGLSAAYRTPATAQVGLTPATGYHSLDASSAYRSGAPASESAYTAQAGPASAWDAQSMYTARPPTERATPAMTTRGIPSEPAHTAHSAPTAYTGPGSWDTQSSYSSRPPAADIGERQRQYTVAMGMGMAPEMAGTGSGTQSQSQFGTNSSSTVTRFGFPLTESSNFSSSASPSQVQSLGQGAPAPAPAVQAPATAAAATAAYQPSTASAHTAQHPTTPLGTAQPFTHSPSAATAQQPSEAGTADMFSLSVSSHTARQPTTLAQTAVAGTAQPVSVVSAHTAQGPATPARTAGEHSATTGMWTPQGTGAYGIPQVAVTGASPSQPSEAGSGGAGTAPTATRSAYTDALGPRSATTGLGAPQSAVASAQRGSQSYQTAPGSYFGTAHGTGAGGGLGSPFQTPPVSERDRPTSRMSKTMSEASYHSASPPVPSRDSHYSTASPEPATASIKAPSTRAAPSAPASPTRYQLHDAPVPAFERSMTEGRESHGTGLLPPGQQPRESTYYGTVDGDDRSAYQSRPPTTHYATARTDPRTAPSVGTAPTSPSRSPRSSEWDTAPPPPISHDSRESRDARSEKQSTRYTDGLGSRRGSRAWTQVSHPDEDDEMLAELERRSSSGSSASHVLKGRGGYAGTAGTPSRTMWTTQSMGDGKESTRTPLGTARENTMYETARESAYTAAGSWETQVPSTYALTVPGTQTYFTAQTSQGGPIRAQVPSTQAPAVPSERPISDGPAYEKPISISTASTVPSPRKIPRVPPPVMPYAPMVQESNPAPPSPSVPSVHSSSHQTSEPTTASSSSESDLTVRAENTDVNRLLNFLQGQEMAKTGQTTRIGNQLDRIERKVTQIAENQSALASRDQPPPVPSKKDEDDEEEQSMPSSPTSSTSSLETARPVTPPPLIIPEVINQQFDDLRNLLGTLIGRQEDLLGRQDMMARELERKRSFDVELPDRGPEMSRLEDLLKRVLQRVGDSEFGDEYQRAGREERRYPASVATPRTEGTRDGSMYEGGESVCSGEFNARGRQAPANSITSEQHRRRHGPPSDIPESLLDGELPSPEFDDEWAIANLPPDTPPREFVSRQSVMPPRFARQTPRQAPQMATSAQQPVPQSVPLQHQPIQEYPEEEYYEEEQDEPITEEYEPSLREPEPEPEPTPVPTPREATPRESPIQPPVPYRTEDDSHDQHQPYSDDVYNRGPINPGPPPQRVDLPTPVNSPRTMPPYQPQPQMMSQGMRPPFPGPGMPPMAPGMSDMPRPSLPRIAGVRDPISTTYFRRGFPPGPMGPMGMFPGPMGVPGPGMGPFMPGLRPGMSGFGGPIGPNVNPSLRRPGFFPPGVAGTTGDYGLPAAARYGNGPVPPGGATLGPGPPRPAYGSGQTTTADTGLDITTSEPPSSTTTTPSVSSLTEIRTPMAPATHFNEPVEVSATTTMAAPTVAAPSSEMGYTDDGIRRTLDNNQALAAAQGDQQNEMSRYLHGMSDQIADGTLAAQNQLAEIMGDIAALREQLKPKHVHAHVLPDGTVMLDNGDIIDGVRGVPAPVPAGVPPPPPPPVTAPHVEGKILPDGTVMVGGKIVDGIKGAPTVATPATPAEMLLAEEGPSEEDLKNAEQDRKLAELSDKIAELMARSTAPPITTFEEEEVYSIKADTASPAPDPTALLTPPAPAPAPTTFAPGGLSFVPPPASSTISKTKSVLREREIVREGPNGKTKEVVFEEAEEAVGESNLAGSAPAISVVPPSGVGSTPLVAATFPPGTVIVTGAGTAPPGTVTGTGTGTAPPGTVTGTVAGTGAGTAPPGTGAGTAPPGTVAPGPGSVGMGDPPATAPSARINPRTGKPISMPPMLAPTPFSPIKTDYLGDNQPSHLIREEHEEIIQHPGGGPPTHTITTSRTHTQLPPTVPVGSGSGADSGSGGGAGAASGGPPATVFADPHKSATAPGTVPAVSVHPPSSAAPPHMPTTTPGVQFSDHQSVVEQGPPNIPATTSVHESKTIVPGPIPIDTANTSVSQTRQPPATVANVAPTGGAPSAAGGAPAPPPKAPTNVAANVPTAGGSAPSAAGAPAAAPSAGGAPAPSAAGAPAPSAAGGPAPGAALSNVPSNAKPPAQVWDTNHAKSPKPAKATELSNVPSAPPAGGAPPAGAPAGTAQNVPSTGAGGPSGAPGGGAVAPPSATVAGDAAGNPAPPAGSKPKSGVHWDSIVPSKGMSDAAGRSPKATAATPPPATELANVPVVNDPSGAGGIPASSVHEVAGLGAGAAPGSAAGAAPGATAGGAPGSATNAAKDSNKGPLSGILRKPKSQENIKSSTTQPGGGLPMVPADTAHHADHSTVGKPSPTVGGGKDTRVSDTAHVSRPPTMGQLATEGRDLTAYPGGQTVHVPAQPTASGPSNKLRKQPPQLGTSEGSMADPRNLADNMAPGTVSQPGSRAPLAAHPGGSKDAPVVLEEVTLPDGRTAYVKSNPPSAAGSQAGRAGGATSKPVPSAAAIPDLPLPAEASASAPPPGARPPSTLKKGKGAADEPGTMVAADGAKDPKAPGAASAASGHGPHEPHCSVCCPHGARLPQGVPIEACAHQDGPLGAIATGGKPATPSGPRSQQKSGGNPSRPPSVQRVHTPEAEGAGEGEAMMMGDGAPGSGTKSAPGSKLSKGKKAPSEVMTPEDAMEDARKLAVRQKAAAEQAASEKAEKDAKHAEKEAKKKAAEERHMQNVKALEGLQKLLETIAAEQKTERAASDDKITKAIEKLGVTGEEAKKKQAAEDKKGTQATLDAIAKFGKEQGEFLREFGADIMSQNSDQHKKTQDVTKANAREQVGFNLAGYLDDFSKALSGEVRTLLKEVGDLRESRRALYMELAELLLMKHRQSSGDLMAILPYPAIAGRNMPKKEEKKPDGKPKNPAGPPAWAGWAPMMPPAPGRTLPQPNGPSPISMSMGGGMVPPPPNSGARPLPQV
ncbi:hypothetical protein IAT38_008214 [Cryptococcus sp. DSM 104549]